MDYLTDEQSNIERPLLVTAGTIVDGAGLCESPGAVLVEGSRIVAAGAPASIGVVEGVQRRDCPGAVVMPGLVNVHAHLDLSHIGPVPFAGDFATWIDGIRSRRLPDDEAVADSVARGATLSRAGGTAMVGDIAGAGSTAPIDALRASGLGGVAFLEVFGLGARQSAAIDRMTEVVTAGPRDASGVRLGLQPHAPYSCGLEVYRAAAALGLPVATHLAESPEEIEFIGGATGPLAEMLARIGVPANTFAATNVHPVDHLGPILDAAPWLLVHMNYLEPRHLGRLAATGVSIAYCPRASTYFGHPRAGHAPHAYAALAAAGVPVALGTDSLLCLDTPERISVLDEMRLLHRRDGLAPRALLAMATVAGAEALGLAPELVTLRPGPTAGLIAVDVPGEQGDALAAALRSDAAPRWVHGPVPGDRW